MPRAVLSYMWTAKAGRAERTGQWQPSINKPEGKAERRNFRGDLGTNMVYENVLDLENPHKGSLDIHPATQMRKQM